jgi:hypothetical protein
MMPSLSGVAVIIVPGTSQNPLINESRSDTHHSALFSFRSITYERRKLSKQKNV